jgi:hypothetical protein
MVIALRLARQIGSERITLGIGQRRIRSVPQDGGAIVCASALMTPQNAASETERLIAEALYHRRPVYMAFPSDVADMPVPGPRQR